MKSTQFSWMLGRCTIVETLGLIALGSLILMGTDAKAQEFELELTGITANVNRADRPVQINLMRWSSEAERDAIVTAWTEPDTTSDGDSGGQRGGFGGRGGGGDGGEREPVTPIEAVTTVIQQNPIHGHIWTDGPVGYSVRYAARSPLPDGGERILLATYRRLDAHTPDWAPTVSDEPTDYEFTLIELRLDSDGAGVGRTSLTTEVTLDADTGALVLDEYAAAPVIFDKVNKR